MRIVKNPKPQLIKQPDGGAVILPDGTYATIALKQTLLELVSAPAIANGKTGMDAVFAAIDVRNELKAIDWDAEEIDFSDSTYSALDAAIKAQQFNLQFAAELGVIFDAWRNARFAAK